MFKIEKNLKKFFNKNCKFNLFDTNKFDFYHNSERIVSEKNKIEIL